MSRANRDDKYDSKTLGTRRPKWWLKKLKTAAQAEIDVGEAALAQFPPDAQKRIRTIIEKAYNKDQEEKEGEIRELLGL